MPPEETEASVIASTRPSNQSSDNGENPFNETVQAHMMQIMGQQQYIPTQAQVDKILELQEKGMDYTHDERTNTSPQQKIAFWGFVIAIAMLLAIFVITVFFAKEYISQVVSGVLGILAGSGIGYGYGKSKATNSNT